MSGPQILDPTANNFAAVARPDGKVFYFNLVNGVWVPDGDISDQLTELTDSSGNPTGWQYRSVPDDEVETYDSNGRLLSISDRAGLTQTLSYDAGHRLSSVTDPAGRALEISYDSQGRASTLIDPAGSVYTYGYDSNGNLISVQYPDGKIRGYVYNEPANTQTANLPNALTGIVDENGTRFATFKYDPANRAVSTEHAGGVEKYAFQYNGITTGVDGSPIGSTTTVTDPLNTSRTYKFQTTLSVVKIKGIQGPPCPNCGSAATSYDPNNNLALRLDFNNNLSCYTYDLTRNLETQRVEGLSGTRCPGSPNAGVIRTISTAWHPAFRLPIQIADPNRITTYVYDSHGNLTSKSAQATTDLNGSQRFSAPPTGNPRIWTYTNTYSATVPALLVQQVVDGPRTDVSDVTTYFWDNSGNLITVTNALGQITTLGNYDAHGRPQQITDPNGLVTTLSYDVRGRLTSRNVGGETTSYTYDGVGQLTQVSLPDGSFLAYTYDAAHRLTQIQDSLNNKIVYTLDNMGNRVQEQVFDSGGALARTRSRVYDSLNRLAQDIGGVATEITRYGYDSQGNLTSITDPLGHITTQAFDALNRLVRITDPQSGQTQYSYDGLDQLTGVTDPRSLATSYTLDGLGNLTQLQSPDSGATTSTQDAAGNLVSQTDARGVVASFTYDALNRLTRATYAPPAGSSLSAVSLLYSYDQGQFGLGRLTGFSDPSGSTAYSYDVHGRLTSETRTLAGVAYTTAYRYDSAGRLNRITYPSGRTVDYGLDALGRIQQIDTSFQGTSQSLVSGVSYQPFGSLTGLLYGNAQGYSRSYDLDGRISAYTLAGLNRSVPYDDASRITGFSHVNTALNQSFGYDTLDRLTGWASATSNQSFAYDLTGNRLSQSIGANSYTYSYSATSNRLSSISGASAHSYQYDAAGNSQSDGLRSFAYDVRGRLIHAVNGSVSADYQLNALGQRVAKSVSGAPASLFHYDRSGHLISESDASGHPLKEYVWLADTPVAVLTTSAPAPACPAAPVSDSGASFAAFAETEGLEVEVGEPDRDDWQWSLGSNTGASGQFVSSSFDWVEHKSYRWTLTYDGKGSGTYAVFDGTKKLGSRTFNGSRSKLLHAGNALRFVVRSGAHTRAGDVISVSISSLGSSAVSQTLATSSSGGASQQSAYFAGSSLSAGFSAEGTIELDLMRHRHHHKHKLDLGFLVNAGNVACSQPTQAKVDLAYIQSDHLDTPRTVTDAAQKVIWQWDNQDPFGANPANEDPDGDGKRFTLNLRFPGQYFDKETGLHQNYFRDYDPSTGRYVESDPIGLRGGLNTYAYVGANPLKWIDRKGLAAIDIPVPDIPLPGWIRIPGSRALGLLGLILSLGGDTPQCPPRDEKGYAKCVKGCAVTAGFENERCARDFRNDPAGYQECAAGVLARMEICVAKCAADHGIK